MKRLDAKTLKRMLISGANNLYNHYPEIDQLNVFPVPDGDTGMNMNLTVTSGVKEIQNAPAASRYLFTVGPVSSGDKAPLEQALLPVVEKLSLHSVYSCQAVE